MLIVILIKTNINNIIKIIEEILYIFFVITFSVNYKIFLE
jgi:hypothetical protein